MALSYAPEFPVAVVGETNNYAVSFAGILDSGELIASVTSVAEQTSSDLTITNETINTAALVLNHLTVAIGMAVQFTVVGQLMATATYTLKITVVANGASAQTKIRYVRFKVEA